MAEKLIVSSSPHIRTRDTGRRIMWSVCAALFPAAVVSVIIFGLPALKVLVISVLSCVAVEALIQKLTHKKVTVNDGSAVLTGILLAFNLSSSVPFWIPLVGAVFAIAVVKQAFGGLGMNIFNPALAARAFLLASWPRHMTSFPAPFSADAVSTATPLMLVNEAKVSGLADLGISYWDFMLGRRGGCLGEVCIIALLIGAAYLLWKKYIWIHAPAGFIITLGALSWMFGPHGLWSGDFFYSVLAGGVILGAFFMATDYVSTPLTKKGQVIFGVGCGLITFVIRVYGGYPEGVSYSILIMNATTPLIDRHIRPRTYGTP